METGVTLFPNRIERWQLRPGDHIYTWRNGFFHGFHHHGIYESDKKVIQFTSPSAESSKCVHTGIYESDKKVIHFTNPSAQSSTGFSSSSDYSSSSSIFCWECRRQFMHGGGVFSCCLDCFLEGDNHLCLFPYSEPFGFSSASGRVMVHNCRRQDEDPPEAVLERANHLLRNGLGTYDAAVNNCFDLAFYCKTGGSFVPPQRAPVDPPTCMIL